MPGDLDLLAHIEDFANEHQVSVKTILHAGWAATLSRHLETHDAAFFTNLRDCSFDPTEYIVGPMDVTAPLRIRLSDGELTLEKLHRLEREKNKASRYSFLGGRVIQEQSRSKTGLQSTFMVLESEIPDPIIQELKCPMQVTFEFAGCSGFHGS